MDDGTNGAALRGRVMPVARNLLAFETIAGKTGSVASLSGVATNGSGVSPTTPVQSIATFAALVITLAVALTAFAWSVHVIGPTSTSVERAGLGFSIYEP